MLHGATLLAMCRLASTCTEQGNDSFHGIPLTGDGTERRSRRQRSRAHATHGMDRTHNREDTITATNPIVSANAPL